jgi:Arc/MetJ family transcription regulator
MEKHSISFDAELIQEAQRFAGPRGLSRLVNTALEQYLQALRLRQLEAEMTAEFGPISEEARQRAAAVQWPE